MEFSQVLLFLATVSSWSASHRGLLPLGKLRERETDSKNSHIRENAIALGHNAYSCS